METIRKYSTSNPLNEDFDPMLLASSQNLYTKPIAFQYDLFLTDEIGESKNYNQWLQTIGNAGPNDIIAVHINSPGGSLDTAVQLYGALLASQAMVSIYVEGACCSGASMILMAADQLSIEPNSYFLIHSYSGGNFGTFNKLQESSDFQKHWFPQTIRTVYKYFLTEEEISNVLGGKDIWLTSEEVIKRFKAVALAKQEELMKTNPELAKQMMFAQHQQNLLNGDLDNTRKKKVTKNSKKKPIKHLTKKSTKKVK